MNPASFNLGVAEASPDLAAAAREYLDWMLFHPKTTLHFGLTAGCLVLVLAYVLPKIETAYLADESTSGKGWIMAVLGPVLLILAASVAKVYVVPSLDGPVPPWVVLIGGMLLMFLLVVVPIAKFLFKSDYSSSFFACGITFLCGAVAVVVMHVGFRVLSFGELTAEKIEEHRDAINGEQGKRP